MIALQGEPSGKPDNPGREQPPQVPVTQIEFQNDSGVSLTSGVLVGKISLAGEKQSNGSPSEENAEPTKPPSLQHGVILSQFCVMPQSLFNSLQIYLRAFPLPTI